MRLAVFTAMYPARVASFFERDMRGLIDAGIEIDVFAIRPLQESFWKLTTGLLGPARLPRNRVHHLGLVSSVRQSLGRVGKLGWRDALRILPSAVRFGPVPLAKTAYALPKAWAWAAQYGHSYDHILAYWGNYAGTCAYAFHRLAGRPIPYSIWLHAGTDLYSRPVFMREKLLYADNIITCCEFNQDFITRTYDDIAPQIAAKIHVSHHGLDLAQYPFQPGGRPPSRVLAVGRLSHDKGFDHLLRAAARLRERHIDIEVEFVGDGKERAALESLSAQLGITDLVNFRGWVPLPEVRRAMTNATVLVHPSDQLGDGLPNVLREAMALGTPVVASDVAGIPDALRDGCGVLVPPGNVPRLADAIAQVLSNPRQQVELATRARRRAEERYDLWRNGSRLASLLRASRRGEITPEPEPAPPPITEPLRIPSTPC
jgi:colanic acid/amylovoran biosynthesis glycosyltransferase